MFPSLSQFKKEITVSHSPNIGISATQSERGRDSAQEKPIDCSPQTVVVLRDKTRPTANIVTNQFAEQRHANYMLPSGTLECSPRESWRLRSGNGSSQDASSFSAIRALKLKGSRYLYENDLFMQIGTRCRRIVSGSFLLLDSAAKVFLWSCGKRCSSMEDETNDTMRKNESNNRLRIRHCRSKPKMISVFRW